MENWEWAVLLRPAAIIFVFLLLGFGKMFFWRVIPPGKLKTALFRTDRW